MVFLEWILKYWLQVLFGLICAGVGIFWKRIKAWRQAYKQKEAEALKDSIVKDLAAKFEECSKRSDANDKMIQAELGQIKDGLLSVQGAAFKARCRELLKDDHVITIEEMELLTKDHQVYNGLGGNHVGDGLFNAVSAKFESQKTLQ